MISKSIEGAVFHPSHTPFIEVKEEKTSPLEKIKNRIRNVFRRTSELPVPEMNVLDSQNLSVVALKLLDLAEDLLTLMRSIMGGTKKIVWRSKELSRALTVAKFVSAVFLVYYLYRVYRACIKIPKAHGVNERIDVGLRLMDRLSHVGDSASTLLTAFSEVHVLPAAIVGVISPLFVASAVLSLVSIVAHAKGWYETRKLMNEMTAKIGDKAIDDLNAEDLKEMHAFLEKCVLNVPRQRILKKYFKIAGPKKVENIKETVGLVFDQIAADRSDKKACLKGKKIAQLLLNRLENKIIGHRIAIVAAIVSIIGIALLFTPLAPLGFGCIAAGVLISLTIFFYKWHQDKQFWKQWKTVSSEAIPLQEIKDN